MEAPFIIDEIPLDEQQAILQKSQLLSFVAGSLLAILTLER